MSEFNMTNKVVQSNDLIKAINKLDRTTFKLFEMAVSCIDTMQPKQEVILSKTDIFNFFDMESTNRYTRMEEVMKRLSQQGIIIQLEDDRKRLINVTSFLEWGTKDSHDEVKIEFNAHIMPYLVELKNNFTQYQIAEIQGLTSKYSLILFKWLKMRFNAHQSNPLISMTELRELTDTVDNYNVRFSVFEDKVLKVATDEINEHTSLKISYEKIARKGRKISDIKWHIKEKSFSNAISIEDVNDPNGSIIAIFEQEWQKSLNKIERDTIRVLSHKYGENRLIDALRQTIIHKSTSLRFVEVYLRETNDEQLSVDDVLKEAN